MRGDVEESGNKENQTSLRGASKQLTPCGKKDGGYHPVINFKILNQRLRVQTGLAGSILSCPIQSTLDEVCKVSKEVQDLYSSSCAYV